MEIWHLAVRSHWEAARTAGEYAVSTRGMNLDEVGFIHASLPHQLPAVAEFVYSDEDAPLCVLVLDTQLIEAAGTEVRFEDGGDGELYPHVYGAIDPAWVISVRSAHFDEDGRLEVIRH